jgi:hypothetical protein
MHGPAGLVFNLILDLFTSMLRLFACLAELVRTGQLPVTAPSPRRGASPGQVGAPGQPHVRLPDPRPRQSGWLEHRAPEAASDGGITHGLFEQPDITQPIAETPQVSRISRPPCGTPATLPLPATLPRHGNDGTSPRWRGQGILWTTEAAFLRFDSKKWVCGGGPNCVHFVTI